MELVIKLNLGCGAQTPEGWINVDYALGARLAKLPLFSFVNRKFLKLFNLDWTEDIFIHDLRNKFPWRDNSIDIIYSSHTLEHLSKEEGLHFLKECHRTLRIDGLIRIVVPDLFVIVTEYINDNIRGDEFLIKLGVLYYDAHHGPLKRKLAPFIHFPHRCMYDRKTLSLIMMQVGFEVEDKRPSESDIPDIEAIELPGRTEGAVIVEGKKV